MRVINQSGLSIGWCVGRVPPHRLTATCIVKGTYALKHGGIVEPLKEQPSLCADLHEGDDPEKALVYPSDFALFKPACDLLLRGTCHARGGKPATVERVTFAVGRFEKALMVVGDRHWQPGLLGARLSEPAPFLTMPLSFERAFGGAGHPTNPFGRGFVPVEKDLVAGRHPLPNIEDPASPITVPSSRPAPAGFGPLPSLQASRAGKAGTYDRKWLKQNWPFFPDDFDWTFFNSAPPDQRLKDFPRGDEPLRMRQIHPTIASFESRLPGTRPRFFVREQSGLQTQVREALLQLDTIYVDMNEQRVTLLWRGIVPISSKRMSEVTGVGVVTEPLDRPPAPASHYEALFEEPSAVVPSERTGPRALAALPPATSQVAALKAATDAAVREGKLSAGLTQSLQFLAAALEGAGVAPAVRAWTRESLSSAVAAGQDLHGADLSGLDLSGLKLAGARLANAVLAHAKLSKADLTGADLSAVVAADADLSGANLSMARLPQADLVHAELAGADFSGADLSGADFTLARGRKVNFAGAKAAGAKFMEADLERAGFIAASLEGAIFDGARLPRADFMSAMLQGTSFELASVQEANFVDADCTGLKAGRGADFSRAKMAGVRAPRAAFQGSKLEGADLAGANLEGALLADAQLAGVNMFQVHAPHASFDRAGLRGAKFGKANLLKASFEGASLADADFRGANLFEAEFLDATGSSGQAFEGANIKRTKLV